MKRDHKEIWEAFLKNEHDDFKAKMGYGKKSIKKIGIKKFIEAMDWRSEEDVSKWRTDVYNIVVCPNCNNNFGIYQEKVGLCEDCQPKFDTDRFYDTLAANAKVDEARALAIPLLFFSNKEFRDKYKKKSLEDSIKLCEKEDFSDVETFFYISSLASIAINREGDSMSLFKEYMDKNLYSKFKDNKNLNKIKETIDSCDSFEEIDLKLKELLIKANMTDEEIEEVLEKTE